MKKYFKTFYEDSLTGYLIPRFVADLFILGVIIAIIGMIFITFN